ncbi:hypothetical protein [Streptomyces sp. I05A-00742]|uniref:hypothetical protein n=1 Tax=Streptomyces sp. I05A-00742 TaxID=2732853 RepID=UPI001488525D|nr:hypothetical protein [Streptomyces sp. I05A-00742]
MRNILLMAGGAVVIVLGALLLFLWHRHLVDLTGDARLMSGLGWRVAEGAVLYGGTWLCVRGWNGRRTA